jgi:hypothetical protein
LKFFCWLGKLLLFMHRFILYVFTFWALHSSADVIPPLPVRGPVRAIVDRCFRLALAGTFGKPNLMIGVRTPWVIWGPHSIPKIVTLFSGAYLSNEPIEGQTFLRHPLGGILISIYPREFMLEIYSRYGRPSPSNALLEGLLASYPSLRVTLESENYEETNWVRDAQFNTRLKLLFDIARGDFPKLDAGDRAYEAAVQNIVFTLLEPA